MISLTSQEYEALLWWAKEGAGEMEQEDDFLLLRRKIDRFNKIERYTLLIRYDTLPLRVPANPDQMPQGETMILELPRKPTYEDVIATLRSKRYDEAMVYVTADPNGRVGWYQLGSYPW